MDSKWQAVHSHSHLVIEALQPQMRFAGVTSQASVEYTIALSFLRVIACGSRRLGWRRWERWPCSVTPIAHGAA